MTAGLNFSCNPTLLNDAWPISQPLVQPPPSCLISTLVFISWSTALSRSRLHDFLSGYQSLSISVGIWTVTSSLRTLYLAKSNLLICYHWTLLFGMSMELAYIRFCIGLKLKADFCLIRVIVYYQRGPEGRFIIININIINTPITKYLWPDRWSLILSHIFTHLSRLSD